MTKSQTTNNKLIGDFIGLKINDSEMYTDDHNLGWIAVYMNTSWNGMTFLILK